ncbi:MAG: hypothetical protein U0231_10410 [Nitrospiraceae bacterium]
MKKPSAWQRKPKKATEEAEKKNVDVDDNAFAKEVTVMGQAKKAADAAAENLKNFTTHPARSVNITRPDLTMRRLPSENKLAEIGKRLYVNKYGCQRLPQDRRRRRRVGPALD